jgi:hypothetical protein
MVDDLLERMRRNPAGDCAIGDVETVCRKNAVSCEPARGGGAYYKVPHPMMAEKLTVPYKRPIKPVYIRKRVGLIAAVRAL